jgi:hypothetical protein
LALFAFYSDDFNHRLKPNPCGIARSCSQFFGLRFDTFNTSAASRRLYWFFSVHLRRSLAKVA